MTESLPGPLAVHTHYSYSGYTLQTEGKFHTPGPGRNALFTTVILPDGSQHRVQIDTGSCGLVLPASLLKDPKGALLPFVRYIRPYSMTYEPSGDVVAGAIYAIESVQFPLAGGGTVSTDPIYLLGTDKHNPGMMGIGFGRAAATGTTYPNCVPPQGLFSHEGILPVGSGGDDAASGKVAQLSNALLNISGMFEGSVPSNYVITSGPIAAVSLGVDSADLEEFEFINLNRQYPHIDYPANSPYYSSPDYTITLEGYNGGNRFSCPALLDTGVDCLMIRLPPDGDGKSNPSITGWTSKDGWASQTLLGQTLTVAAYSSANSKTPIMQYSFVFGTIHVTYSGLSPAPPKVAVTIDPAPGSTAMAPSSLLPREEASAGATTFFINVGINPLANYDYCFDAKVGRVGFRPALAPYDDGAPQTSTS